MVRWVWPVAYLPEAEQERGKLPARERAAVDNAVRKLEALGPDLPYPHSSDVQAAPDLRELRPRGGNSPTRPLYARRGGAFVIAAIGPEAQHDLRGFRRACQLALERLEQIEED
jgi:hypothetical protein